MNKKEKKYYRFAQVLVFITPLILFFEAITNEGGAFMFETLLHTILLAFVTLIKSQQAGKSNLLGEDIANYALVAVGIAASNLIGIYASIIANVEEECFMLDTCDGLAGFVYYLFISALISVFLIWVGSGIVYLFKSVPGRVDIVRSLIIALATSAVTYIFSFILSSELHSISDNADKSNTEKIADAMPSFIASASMELWIDEDEPLYLFFAGFATLMYVAFPTLIVYYLLIGKGENQARKKDLRCEPFQPINGDRVVLIVL